MNGTADMPKTQITDSDQHISFLLLKRNFLY